MRKISIKGGALAVKGMLQVVYMHGIAVKALFLVCRNSCNYHLTLEMIPYDSKKEVFDIFSDALICCLARR